MVTNNALTTSPTYPASPIYPAIETLASFVARYGLVVVLGWIGALKFTAYEAAGIQSLISHSPLLSWLYNIFSVQMLSNLVGVVEILAAILLAAKPLSRRLSAIGAILAIMLFLITISFLITTPGVTEAAAGGFPALASSGQFLLKDVALLGISLWALADSLRR